MFSANNWVAAFLQQFDGDTWELRDGWLIEQVRNGVE
jgi:hypothetical protein